MRDKNLLLATAQVLTSTAATTDYINQGASGQSVTKMLFMEWRITTSVTGTSPTVQFAVQSADDSGFSTNLTTHLQTTAIAGASLPAGTIVRLPMPTGLRQYIRGYMTAGGTVSAGAADCQITDNPLIPLKV